MCLTAPLTPEEVRRIRLRAKASQAVFVGTRREAPRAASLKLLTLVAKKGLQAVA
jgi:DNA-binding transcriptional regulator YiaG